MELTLENLPIDIYHFYIFKHLNLIETSTLKMVSTKLYSIVDSFKIKELCILDVDDYPDFDTCYWFTTDKAFDDRYQIDGSRIHLLKKPPNNLLNLKYLRIDDWNKPINLKDLNKFTQIEILHIYLRHLNGSDYLQLPKLRALVMTVDIRENEEVVINSPNLQSLDFYSYTGDSINNGLVKFINPHSIKYLKIDEYEERVSTFFSNLEVLELSRLFFGFTKKDFLKLKNLRKLRISGDYWDNSHSTKVKELYRSKKRNQEIILAGVIIKNVRILDSYKRGYGFKHEFQETNRDDLEDLSSEPFFCIGDN